MDCHRMQCFKWIAGTAPLFAMFILCACSLGRSLETAKLAVDQFHRELAAARDDTIYDGAGTEYWQSITRESNHGMMARIRRKLGSCKESLNTQFFNNATTSGTFVTLHYKSTCTNGELDEDFKWRIEGDRAVLVGYRASSPLLLTD